MVSLPGRRDAAPYKEMLRIRRTWLLIFGAAARRAGVGAPYMEAFRMRRTIEFVEGALTHSLPQRGRVSPTRATGEGERDVIAMRK